MKHTLSAVFLSLCIFAQPSLARTLFFLHPDSLYSFDTYSAHKVIQGKVEIPSIQISTSIVDFSKDDYTQISPFLLKTGAFKKVMAIKVMKYSIFQRFTLNEREYLEQTTGYFLIDSTQISPIRQVTIRSDNISNEYYDFNVTEKTPLLTYKNYLNKNVTKELKYKELFTNEQLIWVIRFMAELKIENKKLHLLPPMVQGQFSDSIYFAEVQFEKEYLKLQGVDTQKVTVTRDDKKVAEYWVSLEASKRVFKAKDFLGGWINLKKSSIEPMHNWPF